MTYAQSIDNSEFTKTLPQPCCNGPSGEFQEPEFMKRDCFINILTPKYTENDREWIACRRSALKAWRNETFHRLWSVASVTRSMFDNLLIPDVCLAALDKSGGSLNIRIQLADFLKS